MTETANGNGAAANPGNDGGDNKGAPPAAPGNGDGGGSPAARPDHVPEDLWDADAGTFKVDDAVQRLRDAESYKAGIQSLAAQVPEKPDGYSIEPPKDLDLGEGVKWEPDENDPLIQPAREWAHKHGVSQRAFSELIGIYAKGQVDGDAQQEEFLAEEKKAMGEKADERIEAAAKFLEARLSKAQAAALKDIIQFKDGLNAVENLMTIAGGPQAGRSGGEGGRDKPDLSKMTLAEKEKHAEKEFGGFVSNLYARRQ